MEKVIVTGSCGFIGHHLVKFLMDLGYYVIGIDNLTTGRKEYKDLADKFIQADIREELDFSDIKYVFHTAAQPSIPISIENPVLTHDINVGGTLNVLMAAKKAGVKKVVYSSSSSVYGDQETYPTSEKTTLYPLTPYGAQKLAAEYYCEVFRHTYQLQRVSLRYFNVFGEEQREDNPYTGVITKFLRLKKEGQPLTIYGDGEQKRDFTYVGDIVRANVLAAEKGEGVYNVGTGKSYSVNQVAEAIGGETIHTPPRVGDPLLSLADNEKIKNLGWSPKVDMLKWLNETSQAK